MDNSSQSPVGFDPMETIYRHNLWANTRLFALCATLTDDQLDTGIIGTFGTIRDTLHHIASAEYSYWHRLKTGQPFRRSEGAPEQTMAELQESIRISGDGLITLAPTSQPDDSIEINWDGSPRNVPAAIILNQAINHATEHRAQIMATLTQLGIEPPELDSWRYFETVDNQ